MRLDVVKHETDDARVPPASPIQVFSTGKTPNIRTWELRAGFSFSDGPPPIVWDDQRQALRSRPKRRANPARERLNSGGSRNEALLRFLGRPHNAHVHLTHFQILERNGKQPLAHERGWKDTVPSKKARKLC